jgi:hypothetical protein
LAFSAITYNAVSDVACDHDSRINDGSKEDNIVYFANHQIIREAEYKFSNGDKNKKDDEVSHFGKLWIVRGLESGVWRCVSCCSILPLLITFLLPGFP